MHNTYTYLTFLEYYHHMIIIPLFPKVITWLINNTYTYLTFLEYYHHMIN